MFDLDARTIASLRTPSELGGIIHMNELHRQEMNTCVGKMSCKHGLGKLHQHMAKLIHRIKSSMGTYIYIYVYVCISISII